MIRRQCWTSCARASDRKLRLFAVACCRGLDVLPDAETEAAVGMAEQFADGRATEEMLAACRHAIEQLYRIAAPAPAYVAAYFTCATTLERVARVADAAVRGIAQNVSGMAAQDWPELLKNIQATEGDAQSALLRDIFNPFRTPPSVLPSWFAWNDGAVSKMAQLIYDDRAFDRLPILADALEDAGCDNPDILAHCRSGGEHVRGCWVVDLLLGKS